MVNTACIDATKAFDEVWHKSLLRKLYTSGITGTNWNILQDSYHAMSSVVNYCYCMADPQSRLLKNRESDKEELFHHLATRFILILI